MAINSQFEEKPEEMKFAVRPCMYEHSPILGDRQDVILREMHDKKSGAKHMYYMQCTLCGACGPAAQTPQGAAYKWNARKVKVLEREEFEEIKQNIKKEASKNKNG